MTNGETFPGLKLNDPFADPLVRAVGIEFFTQMLDGEFDPSDFPEGSPEPNRPHPAARWASI